MRSIVVASCLIFSCSGGHAADCSFGVDDFVRTKVRYPVAGVKYADFDRSAYRNSLIEAAEILAQRVSPGPAAPCVRRITHAYADFVSKRARTEMVGVYDIPESDRQARDHYQNTQRLLDEIASVAAGVAEEFKD